MTRFGDAVVLLNRLVESSPGRGSCEPKMEVEARSETEAIVELPEEETQEATKESPREKQSSENQEKVEKEQHRDGPWIIDKQDLVEEEQNFKEEKGVNFKSKEEVRMPRPSDERMEEKVIRDEKERHKLSPLEADKLLPPDQEVGSRVEVQSAAKKCNMMNV